MSTINDIKLDLKMKEKSLNDPEWCKRMADLGKGEPEELEVAVWTDKNHDFDFIKRKGESNYKLDKVWAGNKATYTIDEIECDVKGEEFTLDDIMEFAKDAVMVTNRIQSSASRGIVVTRFKLKE